MKRISIKKRYHHGDLRHAALAIALDILDAEGPQNLNLRAVAERAGVTPMALYRHFDDKAALMGAIAEHGFGLLRQRLGEATVAGPAEHRLAAWGVAYVLFARDHPHVYRLMYDGPPTWQDAAERAALPERPETVLGMMTAFLRAEFKAEEVDLALLTAWSFVHGLASLVIDRRITPFPPDVEALAAAAGALFAARLLAPAST
ncbi:MAG TPA: TetR/AcrR family transcriptional regulator [Roseiarcus sp.]|nr:TetR/AcrR family transcriptional regulator [Roseiarcus sp.]